MQNLLFRNKKIIFVTCIQIESYKQELFCFVQVCVIKNSWILDWFLILYCAKNSKTDFKLFDLKGCKAITKTLFSRFIIAAGVCIL